MYKALVTANLIFTLSTMRNPTLAFMFPLETQPIIVKVN